MTRYDPIKQLDFEETTGAGVTLTGLVPGGKYELRSIVVVPSEDGAAASYILLVGKTAAFTDSPIDGRIAKFDSALVTVDTDHTFDPPIVFTADEGIVRLTFGWDDGPANSATGHVIVERVG